MKKQIIIGRELSVAETDQIRLQEETEIICLDEYKFPFASKTIALSAEEKRDINYSVLDEIKNLGDKLINGYSVVIVE